MKSPVLLMACKATCKLINQCIYLLWSCNVLCRKTKIYVDHLLIQYKRVKISKLQEYGPGWVVCHFYSIVLPISNSSITRLNAHLMEIVLETIACVIHHYSSALVKMETRPILIVMIQVILT